MDSLEKGHSVDELQGHEPGVALGEELLEVHQVGVGQIDQGAKLALEAKHAVRIEGVQRLEGLVLAVGAIEDLVDVAVPARSEQAHDGKSVVAEEFSQPPPILARLAAACTTLDAVPRTRW